MMRYFDPEILSVYPCEKPVPPIVESRETFVLSPDLDWKVTVLTEDVPAMLSIEMLSLYFPSEILNITGPLIPESLRAFTAFRNDE